MRYFRFGAFCSTANSRTCSANGIRGSDGFREVDQGLAQLDPQFRSGPQHPAFGAQQGSARIPALPMPVAPVFRSGDSQEGGYPVLGEGNGHVLGSTVKA